MKKSFLKGVLLLMLFTPSVLYAQDVKSILTDVLSGSNAASTASSVLSSIIGTKTVSAASLVGTWTYTKPAVAFESKDLLKQAGGSIVSNVVEKKMSKSLAKYGITAGKMTFTFTQDKKYTCVIAGKTTTGTYDVKGATIYFYKLDVKAMTANVKLSGSTLQFTFKADKLLKFVSSLKTLSAASSTLSTISSIAGSYDGMQVGMQFAKK